MTLTLNTLFAALAVLAGSMVLFWALWQLGLLGAVCEQAMLEDYLCSKSIWSVGVGLWEMLWGWVFGS